MRQNKFRAWDKKKNKMFNDVEGKNYSKKPINLNAFFRNDNFIFMQFTGRKDKNGKEDYHKDICKYKDDSGTKQIGIIEQIGGCWKLIAIGGDDEGNQDNCLFEIEHKNIGNIYENPELIK